MHGSTVHCMCTNMHVASMCPSLYDHRMIGKKKEREREREKERKKERGKTAGKQCKQPTCDSIACIWRNEDSPFSARSCPSRCCRAAFSRSSVTKRSECSTWSQNLPVHYLLPADLILCSKCKESKQGCFALETLAWCRAFVRSSSAALHAFIAS